MDRPVVHVLSGIGTKFKADRFVALGLCLVVIAIEMVVVTVIHLPSGMAFIGYLGFTVLVYHLLVGRDTLEAAGLYAFYALLVILIYSVQYVEAPAYFGFSGPEGSFGTDDTYYFSQIAERVPSSMDVREYYYADIHEYSNFLRTVKLYDVYHLMDIIWVNVLGAALLPVFTRELAFEVTGDERVGKVAFALALICPFTLANSLILIRDGWTATLFAGALLFFLRKQYVRMALLGGLLLYIRLASGLQLIFALGIFSYLFYYRADRRWKRFLIAVSILASGILAAYGAFEAIKMVIPSISIGNLFSIFFRSDFLSFFQQHRPGSFLLTIYQQPPAIRIPGSFIFFILFPFVSVEEVTYGDVFVIRGLMLNLYAILFIVYFKYFIGALINLISSKRDIVEMWLIAIAFFSLIFIVSQMSMQIRHKVMLMPLFYVLVGYGYYYSPTLGRQLGLLAAAGLVLVNIAKYLLGV